MEYLNNNGSYNKTFWTNGDKITSDKLNKLEDAVYEISDKYATAAYVNAAIGDVNDTKADRDHAHDEYLTEHQSLEGYATIEDLQNALNDIYAILDNLNGGTNEPDEPEEPEEIPLYVPGEFWDNREITEVTTMVNDTHTDLNEMFYCCTSLQTINGIEDWDTSNVTTMEKMFRSCESLETLDVSSFNTSNVNNMSEMFAHCHQLRTIEGLSNFDTSNVNNMTSMFECCCNNLEYLDLSNFDMSNIWDTEDMFKGCNKLKEIRLDNCSRDTITKITGSRNFPASLVDGEKRKLYISESEVPDYAPIGWEFINKDTDEVIERPEDIIYKEDQFRENWGITEVTTMVTSEHDNLESMFDMCGNLEIINGIEDWDTSNVRNMNNMFRSCESLESLDVSSFNTSNVESMRNMFRECRSLTSLDLSSFDTGNVENMDEMFKDCENLESLDLSNFDVSKVWEIFKMFEGCHKLQTLRLDNCSADTIMRIFTSEGFPTGRIDNSYREVYMKTEAAQGLQALGFNGVDGWRVNFVE